MHDLVIIGAGPAGLSAAIYAIRKKLSVLVLSNGLSSQATNAHLVDNYLGLPEINGTELMEKFNSHARKLGAEIKKGWAVEKITVGDDSFKLLTDGGELEARALIIASGKKYRELDVPGAKDFERKGISYCATCDAPIFKDKVVAVVGGGDAGQDTAWQLTKYAKKIFLINKYPELRGQNKQMQENLKNNEKLEILNDCRITEVKGDVLLKSIKIKKGEEEEKEIEVQGLFVEIGSVPASYFSTGLLKLNDKEEIVVDKNNMTSQKGIFAAGDVTNIPYKQIIIAAGEGAKAALSVYEYLNNK